MGTHPGSKPNPKLRAKLFGILGHETARTIIRSTNDRACTQKTLVATINPKARTKIGTILDWFTVVGILDGSAKRGYRLAVGELIDIFDLVQHSPMQHPLWDTLSRPVGRAILAALLHGQRTRTELNELGQPKAVGNELRVLYGGHVVERAELGRVTWWTLLEAGRYSQILGGMDLIVTHLGNQLASGGIDDVRRLAYPAGHVDDYEPTAKQHRRPPEDVARPLSVTGSDPTVNQRATSQIWRDLADTGLVDAKDIAQAKQSLTRLPTQPFPWASVVPQGTNYIDLPGVADGLLQPLPPMPSGDMGRWLRAVAIKAGTRPELEPLTPGQLRGLLRNTIREGDASYSAADLQLPSILWVGTNHGGLLYAATFDADTNELAINFHWTGLMNLFEEWLDPSKNISNWIQGTVLLQHALKLVQCVVSHEHEYADLVLDAGPPPITEDILRAAAHWTASERQELRRRINQHRSAHVLQPGGAT